MCLQAPTNAEDAVLLDRMQRLAAIVGHHAKTPTFLKKHARVMQELLSLDELHAHEHHERYTMLVLTAGAYGRLSGLRDTSGRTAA
jgi:hypothetical protein